MRKLSTIRPWAFLIGIALSYRLCLILIWGYLPRYNPITNWILETYARSNADLYYTLVNVRDTVVNILLALPFAYLILRIKPDRRWLYAAAVVLALFVWEYRLVLFVHRDFFSFITRHDQALFGVFSISLVLPAALLIWSVVESRRRAAMPQSTHDR